MIKNNFIVALRNFWHNKVISLINIFGLAIGISAALVIYLIVGYDFSFDKFEKDRDRIYRIVSDFSFSGEAYHNSGVPFPMGDAVQKEVTGIDNSTAFFLYQNPKVIVKTQNTAKTVTYKKQPNVVFADNYYFTFLPYQWLAGSPKTALKDPFQVVLTESRAKEYFPGIAPAQVIGREITYNDSVRTTVSGVVKDLKKITDFTFKDFISLATIPVTGLKNNMGADSWESTNSASQFFIKLSSGTQPAQIERQVETIKNKYRDKDQQDNPNNITTYNLQPLRDIHFNSDYDFFDQRLAHKPTLYGLLLVALFLLLLGCINFINLTTAHASQRAKEIGIRKTLGSSKPQLIFQFLSETLLLTLAATALSVAFTPLLLKIFSDFIPKELHFNLLQQPQLLLFLFLLVIIVSLLSGFYPALILSGYKPVLVLKNQAYTDTGKTRKAFLRRTLTVSQFLIAQVFIMATLVVSKQIQYSLNKDMGFKKKAIVYFYVPVNFSNFNKPDKKRFVLSDKLKSIPGIAKISLAGAPPASNSIMSDNVKYKDGKKEISTDVYFKYADPNYISLYQMKLLAGKNLQASDTAKEFIINETYAHILGFQHPQDAVGETLDWNGKTVPVAGVIQDFNQRSLHEPIKPIALTAAANNHFTFHIALQPLAEDGNSWKTTIRKMQNAFKEVYPDDDFDYHFFDESIAEFYKSEQNISRLLTWATGLAILISCLGLLGLVMYTTNNRLKEIGVRKVLGASVSQIVLLLSVDFIRLVLIAFVIAAPIAWWAMNRWLDNFAYRTSVSWWIFVLSLLSIGFASVITLSIQTIKAAMANPVKSLRTE
jgi:predicted permease